MKRRIATLVAAGAVATLLAPGHAAAQAIPVGPPIEIARSETTFLGVASVAVHESGGFVVSWGDDTSGSLARFAPDASRVEPDLPLPAIRTKVELRPQGGYLLGWEALVAELAQRPFARIVDDSGATLREIAPLTAALGAAYIGAMAYGPDERFVISWSDSLAIGLSGRFEAHGRTRPYRPSGIAASGATDFAVDETGEDGTIGPYARVGTVWTTPSRYVLAWPGRPVEGPDTVGIVTQPYAWPAAPDGEPRLIGVGGRSPTLATGPAGHTVAAWEGRSFEGLQARRLAADGSPLGDAVTVNSEPLPGQAEPWLGVDGSGGFLVAWENRTGGGFDPVRYPSPFARAFTADATPIGGQFKLGASSAESIRPASPRVGVNAAGQAVIAWAWNAPDDPPARVIAQRYQLTPSPGGCVDADGDGWGAPGSTGCDEPGVDCDDTDPAVNPGQIEVPGNGIDDDCDPTTPAGCQPAR